MKTQITTGRVRLSYCNLFEPKEQVSISFDAAWGAGKWGRKSCILNY